MDIYKESFSSFGWVGDLRGMNFYQGSKELQKEAMTKYGIIIEKLRTDGNERLENGLTFLVKSIKGYRELIQFFRDGGIDPWGEKTKDKIMILPPVEQYLISKEKRLFKGFEEYVHGDGIKYIDYALGAGVKAMSPTPVNPKLDWNEINPLIETIQVSDSKIAEVEAAIKEALRRV